MRSPLRLTALVLACALMPAPLLSLAGPAEQANAAAAAMDAAPAGIRSDTNDFTVDSFDARYDLGRDSQRQSTLSTTETIVADFPQSDQNHGIVRDLPRFDRGTNLGLHVSSVTDGTGRSVPYDSETDDEYLVLKIGDADRYVHGKQTYVIRYTSHSVVDRFADTHDAEFYWDVNGTAWRQPFTRVTATVRFHDGIASDLTGDMSCYRGPEGSTDRCPIARTGEVAKAHAESLAAGDNVTIAIGFRYDAFAPRPLVRDNWFFAVVPWALFGLFVIGAAWVLAMRLSRWRNAPGRGIIVAEYAPEPDMYPALAAELLRRRPPWLAAQIVRFAVSGILHIQEHPDRPQSKRYQLIVTDPTAAPLQPGEQALLRALFAHVGGVHRGASVHLDSTDKKLGKGLVAHATDAAAVVKERGLRKRPSRRVSVWFTVGLGMLALASIVHLIAAAANYGATGWTVLLDGVAFAGSIVFFVLSFPPLRLTPAGAEQRDHLKGLREYIQLAEADRIRALQAPSTAERVDVTDHSAIIKLYEKLLPYAMVWGIEKEWIRELEQHYGTDATPDWYLGNSSLIGLAAMSTAVSTGPGSFGASSGGSGSSSFGGSSGGGFSGGGGGGGGGGGW